MSVGRWKAALAEAEQLGRMVSDLSEQMLERCVAVAPRYPPASLLQRLDLNLLEQQAISLKYPGGIEFLRSLRQVGAWLPPPDHQALPLPQLRRALRSFPGAITYEVLYAELRRPPSPAASCPA